MEGIVSENSYLAKNGGSKKYFVVFVICLVCVSLLSIHFLKPQTIQGDGVSYMETMHVLQGETPPIGFIPNRILTTFLGLELIIFLSKIFGTITTAWIFLNLFFYFLLNIFFYKILRSLFQSEKTACIGGLFLASNYALLVFGLNYLMDIGGWTFYIISLYCTLLYMESHQRKYILLSALTVGVGGLFKEYAFLAFIPVLVVLFRPAHLNGLSAGSREASQAGGSVSGQENRRNIFQAISQLIMPGVLAVCCTLAIYVYVYIQFHYTYLDWFRTNRITYVYHSPVVEYIKSLGVLVNVLAFLCIGGIIVIWREWKDNNPKIKLFVLSVGLSLVPIFLWPAITERILFITMPFISIISSFFIKKYEKFWYLFLIPLLLYVIASFFMDSYILYTINLPF